MKHYGGCSQRSCFSLILTIATVNHTATGQAPRRHQLRLQQHCGGKNKLCSCDTRPSPRKKMAAVPFRPRSRWINMPYLSSALSQDIMQPSPIKRQAGGGGDVFPSYLLTTLHHDIIFLLQLSVISRSSTFFSLFPKLIFSSLLSRVINNKKQKLKKNNI